jgi:hypothetical protein
MIHDILKILDTTDLPELEKQRITTDLLRLLKVMGPIELLLDFLAWMPENYDWEEDDVTIDKYIKSSKCFVHIVKGSALFDAMGEFAVDKFPDAGSVEHLKKLKHEADEAMAEPQNLVEYTDILLALFGAAYKAGFTYEQLIEAGESKFEMLQKRTWIRLDDGTYQHCL